METDEYANISELNGGWRGKSSSLSSASSLESSRRHLTPSAFTTKVFDHDDNDDDDNDDDDDNVDYENCDDDDDYEELPDDLPVMSSWKSQNRADGVAIKSSWRGGGTGRDADERVDSAKILEMKTKLRPTVTKVQESSRSNTASDNEVSAMKPFTKGNRSRQCDREVDKAQTMPSAHEVGCGLESVRIVNMKNKLRPVMSRKSSDERQTDNNSDKEPIDGSHFNEQPFPVATPSTATSKFNPRHHQSPIGNEASDARPRTTPTKSSSFPKFTPGSAKSPNYDNRSEAMSAQPIRSNASASAASDRVRPFFDQPKSPATRSTSAFPATINAVVHASGDGFETPSQHRVVRSVASHGRLEDNKNRFNNNLNTRQDNNSTLDSQKWYFGGIGREISEEMLGKMFKETGSYVVRDCHSGDGPYALSVVHNKRIYHMIIRRRSEDNKFSLGRPKQYEKVFNSVIEMITFHQNNPIELIDDSNDKKTISGRVTLTKCPPKHQ